MKRYHIIAMGLLCLLTNSTPQVLSAQDRSLKHPEMGLLIKAQVHNSIHVAVDFYDQPLASLGIMESIPGYILNYVSSQPAVLTQPSRWIEVPCVQAINWPIKHVIYGQQSTANTACGFIRSNTDINRFTIVTLSI